jgi:hypothetical protein
LKPRSFVAVCAAVPASSSPTLPPVDGLKSQPLRRALATALAGKPADLETWLCRYGLGAEPRPNLKLAAALAAELCAAPGAPRLLARFAGNDAAPDTPEVFLPIAAAYGWTARIAAGKDARDGWHALGELAGDERAPVRLGTREALLAHALRPDGGAELLSAAADWLQHDDRELRHGSAGVVLDVLGDRRVVTSLGAPGALLEYLTSVIDEIAGAPRSAERSEERRRMLLALPAACGAAVIALRGGDLGASWLEAECVRARQPDLRSALSDTILRLRHLSPGPSAETIQRLRHALEGSAKPLRDPTRLRPGTGRGRDSRRMK